MWKRAIFTVETSRNERYVIIMEVTRFSLHDLQYAKYAFGGCVLPRKTEESNCVFCYVHPAFCFCG